MAPAQPGTSGQLPAGPAQSGPSAGRQRRRGIPRADLAGSHRSRSRFGRPGL